MMYVDPLLLWTLVNGTNLTKTEIVSSFHMYHKQCKQCPPNITRNLLGKLEFECWVLRGFYPNTNIVFKMTATTGDHGDFVKVTLPNAKTANAMHKFTQQDLNNMTDDILLDNVQVDKELRTPSCMTPKGMKPLKWRKP